MREKLKVLGPWAALLVMSIWCVLVWRPLLFPPKFEIRDYPNIFSHMPPIEFVDTTPPKDWLNTHWFARWWGNKILIPYSPARLVFAGDGSFKQYRVIKVSNLNADGPGSLHACIDEPVARICEFQVTGIIATSSTFQ